MCERSAVGRFAAARVCISHSLSLSLGVSVLVRSIRILANTMAFISTYIRNSVLKILNQAFNSSNWLWQ